MAEERVRRRLAAILAADVVGYSRLMRADETGTLARLKTLRSDLFDPKIAEYGGRLVKTTGDGFLVEFPSAVDAVQLAVDVQGELARGGAGEAADHRLQIRIGINVGDVIVDGDDLFGDGVNVAARLEGLAEPGNIYISGNAYEQVRHALALAFEDLGAQTVKNIDEPVRVYRVSGDPANPVAAGEAASVRHAQSEKPAIAVLPFTNMSGDPEQEYFSDGITEDIITALSRIRQFFVIARNSTFTFKGRAVDVQTVAKELAVRYVLEGSVRKAGNRVRITAQLIDGSNGNHLWAERYDRDLEDIFEVQDEITQTVVGAIGPELERAERNRALQTPPEHLDAWDNLHRGWWHFYKFDKTANAQAQDYFRRAIKIDPSFAPAYSSLAQAKFASFFASLNDTPADDLNEGAESARTAVRHDDRDASGYAALGIIHLARKEHALAAEALHRSLAINPSLAIAHHWLGLVYAFDGRYDEAIGEQETATRLSPNDPLLWAFMNVRGYAHLHSRRFEEAAAWANSALQQPNVPRNPYIVRVIALSHLGRVDEAQRAAGDLIGKFPNVSIANICDKTPLSRDGDIALWTEGLRRAGVPE